MTTSPIRILEKLGELFEAKGLHDLSYRIPNIIREINAAPTQETGVEISDWNSFLKWWGENRGQGLKYVFVDTFGEGSEEVRQVEELVDEAEQHEQALHDFYMLLRAKAHEQQNPVASEPELHPEPGAPEESEEEEEASEDESDEEKEDDEKEDEEEDEEEVDLDLESTE